MDSSKKKSDEDLGEGLDPRLITKSGARPDWHTIESDPLAAFALATLNLSRAKGSERGRLADLIELMPRLEDVAHARANNLAGAAEVRHMASRLAAAACALAVEGDPRCNLDPCASSSNPDRVSSPVGMIIAALIASIEMAERLSQRVRPKGGKSIEVEGLLALLSRIYDLASTVRDSLVIGCGNITEARDHELSNLLRAGYRLAADGVLIAASAGADDGGVR